MLYESAAVLFIDQACLIKAPGVLTYRFLVRVENRGNVLKSDIPSGGDQKQNINAIMVGHPFEMPLHLFCCLHFRHIFIIHDIPTFSSMLVCYSVGGRARGGIYFKILFLGLREGL